MSSTASAPTPPSAASAAAAAGAPPAKPRRKLAGAEFLARIKYKNYIPPQPFDPKSLAYPFPEDLLVANRLSSLEKYAQYSLALPDMSLDLLKLGVFDADHFDGLPPARTSHPTVDERDEALLINPDDVFSGEASVSAAARVGRAPSLADLASGRILGTGAGGRPGSANGGAAEWTPRVRALTDKSRENQADVITSTFEATATRVAAGLRHPRKPGVTAANVYPILPNLRLWPNTYAQLSGDDRLAPGDLMKTVGDPLEQGASQFAHFSASASREAGELKHVRTYGFAIKPDAATSAGTATAPTRIALSIVPGTSETGGAPTAQFVPIRSRLTLLRTRQMTPGERAELRRNDRDSMSQLTLAAAGMSLSAPQGPLRVSRDPIPRAEVYARAAKLQALGLPTDAANAYAAGEEAAALAPRYVAEDEELNEEELEEADLAVAPGARYGGDEDGAPRGGVYSDDDEDDDAALWGKD
ncbi:hypothetical protein H9P43_006146 [Blastocladiella emersonii ATCC 22665]|nr:hypothetical protein H9P43_006146 [Blastocladiella emersonii ATCC 22665]